MKTEVNISGTMFENEFDKQCMNAYDMRITRINRNCLKTKIETWS